MISVREITKIYNGGVRALESVSFDVERGESCAIIGPSGCGKSTLLLIISGLIKPSSGQVYVNGKLVNSPLQSASLILQDYGLFPWKTVYDNIALSLRLRKVEKEVERERVRELLERFGLSEFERYYPKQLSGGMKQRVAIARALAVNPDILLMDEPLSSLDALSRERMQDFLLELWKETGTTMILVTHSIEEAVFLGRKIVILTPRPGKVKTIIDNPLAGRKEYRQEEVYFEKCREIREIVEFGAT